MRSVIHRLSTLALLALLAGVFALSLQATAREPRSEVAFTQTRVGLPPEAHVVLGQIARGGPFQYSKDGSVFQNRENRLPPMPRGYYREYTVPTPGAPDRGARRIIAGGEPPEVYYYTADHYRSFQRITP